jgi:hypothetical protein
MRRRSDALARDFAAEIKPLMPLARQAYGQQKQGTETRSASDAVNALLLEYDEAGGNVTQLSEELTGVITLAGLRRRLRIARARTPLGVPSEPGHFRGNREPVKIHDAVARIRAAQGTPQYGVELRRAYDGGLALSAIANELGVSYYTAWSSMSTNPEATSEYLAATGAPPDVPSPVPA